MCIYIKNSLLPSPVSMLRLWCRLWNVQIIKKTEDSIFDNYYKLARKTNYALTLTLKPKSIFVLLTQILYEELCPKIYRVSVGPPAIQHLASALTAIQGSGLNPTLSTSD